ncbi:tRNA 2-thiouridine(34) synthase MnmA [candidate division GN15 bacterium]|uniref:tRNA-specific 2-thiouridylase MnmA n=1 Tax=candidate division GN15 bacterium TaxID=2072418 RepID=A0A855X797_9BACT|nr:MAG: tRNA 2-thiouridine(34) synthase MnmA [candidate division GN15 bacterium]
MSARVLVAMSGGVDSSVAALLLKEEGYTVIGAHMKLWDYVDVGGDIHKDGRCCTIDSITDCRFVCDAIGAPFYVLNLSAEFRETVIENFVSEYRAGRTPNPCVRCNSEVKWDAFLKKADELGCEYIATGHYAFIERGEEGTYRIRKGVDQTRDQSYVLWGVSQDALKRTLMPLGRLLKSEVREIAARHGLRTATKPESREICFVADDDYRRFLSEYEAHRGRSFEPGDIVGEDGSVLGRHNGTAFYTIGQRKGLGVTSPRPLYVQRIDVGSNQVIVGEEDSLYRGELLAERINWTGKKPTADTFDAEVKIRYLHAPARARLVPLTAHSARVIFVEKQRAVTPGQSVVFYDGDVVLGGGLIANIP